MRPLDEAIFQYFSNEALYQSMEAHVEVMDQLPSGEYRVSIRTGDLHRDFQADLNGKYGAAAPKTRLFVLSVDGIQVRCYSQ